MVFIVVGGVALNAGEILSLSPALDVTFVQLRGASKKVAVRASVDEILSKIEQAFRTSQDCIIIKKGDHGSAKPL